MIILHNYIIKKKLLVRFVALFIKTKQHFTPRASCQRGTHRELHEYPSSYRDLIFYQLSHVDLHIVQSRNRQLNNQPTKKK